LDTPSEATGTVLTVYFVALIVMPRSTIQTMIKGLFLFLLFGLYERKRFNLLRDIVREHSRPSFIAFARIAGAIRLIAAFTISTWVLRFILWSGFNLFGGRNTAGSVLPHR
jgi:hypothetical protein